MTSNAYLQITEALDARGQRSSNRRQNHVMFTCPAHNDHNPSLSIDDAGDRALVYCHGHCHTEDVLASIGMGLPDLYDEEPEQDKAQPVCSYVYKDRNGNPRFIVDRYFPKTFRSRPPDSQPGDKRGVKGIEPILYHADKVWPCMQAGDCTVWLVDGEKDVEACERHGLVATCPPGFGKRWRETYSRWLAHAARVVIVADQDAIKPDGKVGPGQQFAMDARAGLRAWGVKVRVVAPAFGKDAADHFAAGYTTADFVPDTTCSTRSRGMAATDLMEREFSPVEFAVSGILPSGLTICAGSPKAGKSWLALDLALAVAAGGPAMSALPTSQGSTLYLAREDTYRRLQSRIALLMSGTGEVPRGLELVPAEQEWSGGEQGLADMTEWAEEVGNPRLVVVDTLAKVEPDLGEDRSRGAYSGNYSMMSRYKQWADLHNCAVLMIHHDRKADGAPSPNGSKVDPFLRISGTRGITGAADTLWFLETERGKHGGQLHVTGRDVAEQTLELVKAGPVWRSTHLPE